ncbi:hypothetical protein NO559_07860 [Dasania sp. GY-MA-18]|uniref:Uncharacterized protein n=1 Tax=Dasania phycosphaerae TaxID=2950436 RepID=A0A9J6RLP7_9GAMM|nr:MULTISPECIES: hypothetical protein [Dasania]MCR8922681.1 hypothetical protein [Dasania sp. GY-MA-18]MCZ0865111.1 hypothetical protein [Dasania phycosphaerae]MCZ0868837.1 hypothetical protein [Dasania phycosphaerae]
MQHTEILSFNGIARQYQKAQLPIKAMSLRSNEVVSLSHDLEFTLSFTGDPQPPLMTIRAGNNIVEASLPPRHAVDLKQWLPLRIEPQTRIIKNGRVVSYQVAFIPTLALASRDQLRALQNIKLNHYPKKGTDNAF